MMIIRRRRGWEISETAVTPEAAYWGRRDILRALGLGAAMMAFPAFAADPVKRNPRYTVDRPITAEEAVLHYNNFYEFGSDKTIAAAAQALPTRPWTVAIDGMVEKSFLIGIDDLLPKMPMEERVYRHRCVEAWSMVVPWTGFPLKALVDLARPQSGAKYLRFETFMNPKVAPGQNEFMYPWPYIEGLTMAEATSELAFIVTGAYGKDLPKQNGAPLRLATPWKYGFKSTKSIVKITFTDERPETFWKSLGSSEYGFWANVNPEVPHPRWSQAMERPLGGGDPIPTRLYNGYGEFVAGLYKGLENEKLFM